MDHGVAAALRGDDRTLHAFVGAVLDLMSADSPAAAARALADACTTVAGADDAVVTIVGEEPTTPVPATARGVPAGTFTLPIVVAGAPHALLRLERSDRDFDGAERHVAFLLASHGAVVLERLSREADVGALVDQARRARAEAARARADASRLEDLAAAVASGEDLVSTATAAAASIAGAVSADSVELLVEREGNGLELIASSSEEAEGRRVPSDAPTPVGEAFRTRRPVFISAAGSRAVRAVALPLLVAGRSTGVLALTYRRPHRLGGGERALLVALAEIAAQALERAQRTQLQDRTARLHAVTVKLSQASTDREVLNAIVGQGVEALGALAGTAALLSDDGRDLVISAALGYPEEAVAALRHFPLETPYPLADAVRDDAPVLVESRRALARRYPALAGVTQRRASGALVALPLAMGERKLGALGFTFANDRSFDADDVAFLVALAGLAAQALDRAQRSRAFDRTARLQAVAAGLSSASSLADVAAVILEQGGRALGAKAGVVTRVQDETHTLEFLGTRGFPAERARIWPRRIVPAEVARDPLVAAVSSGEPVLLASADEVQARYPAAVEELAEMGVVALAATPLRLEGVPVGAVAFGFEEARDFAPEDSTFLAALSELCAQALQRARLFATVEASRNHLRELLERLHDGLLAVSPSLHVDFANAEALRLLAREALVGAELPARWEGIELAAFARALFGPEASSVERSFETDDGRTFELAGIPGVDSAVIVMRDVSRRERAERAEREFVANAAHELRSPLAGILAAVEALQIGAKELPGERDRLLAGIDEEGRRLGRLVDALLVLARAQADPESLVGQAVDVEPLVTEVARTLDVQPGVRVVLGDCDAASLVLGERVLIEVALQNLARNASKHTERGTITFAWRATGDGRVAIEVRDTGPGMPPEVADRAFDRFYRGGGPDRAGFGLGLPLARELMRILGGEVEIESAIGAGTTARLILPPS